MTSHSINRVHRIHVLSTIFPLHFLMFDIAHQFLKIRRRHLLVAIEIELVMNSIDGLNIIDIIDLTFLKFIAFHQHPTANIVLLLLIQLRIIITFISLHFGALTTQVS